MINIENNFTIIIGGTWGIGKYSALTYYYNHYDNTWSGGPHLNTSRYAHAAGIVIDIVTQEKFVVVTGGMVGPNVVVDDEVRSTEILSRDVWSKGKRICSHHTAIKLYLHTVT